MHYITEKLTLWKKAIFSIVRQSLLVLQNGKQKIQPVSFYAVH